MITEELVLASGYQESPLITLSTDDKEWNKTIFDTNENDLYQITIGYSAVRSKARGRAVFNAKAFFNYPSGATAWIAYESNSIEDIEKFFFTVFHSTNAMAVKR